MANATLSPGMRVRVQQSIQGGHSARLNVWTTTVNGTVVSCEAEPTGSWFAHGKNTRVWLLRVRLRKDDGELTTLNLDERSVVTILALPTVAGAP